MKMGSLFDGSGGFPLAASMYGITPVFASEIEPYPIAVTTSRFPNVRHYGDVSKINGAEVEPVDVLTFGSPCQDLSVAGKRAGLKHEDNGDDETTRSGLFMEAVRIIKEMREATNGILPRFAVWENVPGAYSSHGGEDFRLVLEELIKIVEPNASVPPMPKGGWPYADCYMGDGWSIAYRTLDAQYWGVPQRRKRIYLVADFGGECAGEVLFKFTGLRGYFTQSRTPWQGTAPDAERSVGAADREGEGDCIGLDIYNSAVTGDVAATLTTATGQGAYNTGQSVAVPFAFAPVDATLRAGAGAPKHEADFVGRLVAQPVCVDFGRTADRIYINPKTSVTLSSQGGGMGAKTGLYLLPADPVYCLQVNGIDRADTAGCNGKGVREDVCYTLNTIDRPAVAYAISSKQQSLATSEGKANTLGANDYKEPQVVAFDRAAFNQGQNALYSPQFYTDGTAPTLVAKGPSGVCCWDGGQTVGTLTANNAGGNQRMPDKDNFNAVIEHRNTRYIVRRLTPTECARLQGFPDWWGHPTPKETLTDEEYRFWLDVRNTHAAINGKQVKDYSKEQILTWYNKLHTDSAEYKMWGNGIALPNALYVMQGIAEVLTREEVMV